MTRSFVAAPAVDVASQAKSDVFIGMGSVRYWQQPRFLNWMLNGTDFRRESGAFYTDADLAGGNRGLPPYPLVGGDAYILSYVRTAASPNGSTDAALTILMTNCTVTTTGLANLNTSTPGQITGDYSYANSEVLSLKIYPSAADWDLKIIPTALLSAYNAGKIFLDEPNTDYSFAAGCRFMDWNGFRGVGPHIDRRGYSSFTVEGDVTIPIGLCGKYCAIYDKHAHICLPVGYDEASIRAWVQEFLSEFPADKIVITEFANEIWNSNYQAYATANMLSEWPGANVNSSYDKAAWLTKKSCEAMVIIKDEFALAGRSHQLRTGLNVQTSNTIMMDDQLTGARWIAQDKAGVIALLGLSGSATDPEIAAALNAYIASLHDLILCTGYFGSMPYIAVTHGQEIIDLLATDVPAARTLFLGYIEDDLPNLITYYGNIKSRADARGMGMTMYEGQQHIDVGQLIGSQNSPFWECDVDVPTPSAYTVGEWCDQGAKAFKVVSKGATSIRVGTSSGLSMSTPIVGRSSGASQTPTYQGYFVLNPALEALWIDILWSSEMGAFQDTARDTFYDAGGIFWNQFIDYQDYVNRGNWGTMKWVGDANPVHTALSNWSAANPRRVVF